MSRLDEIKARLESVMKSDLPPNLAFTLEQIAFVEDSPFAIAYLVAEVERLEATVKAVRILVPEWKAPWVNGGWCFWCSGPIPEHFDRCSYVVAQAALTEKEEA